MLAYLNDLCIIGVPGCLVKYKTTVFDAIYPLVKTKRKITYKEVIGFAYGDHGREGCQSETQNVGAFKACII